MPELAELSTDEEARVKVQVLHTVVELLDFLSPTCRNTQVCFEMAPRRTYQMRLCF